MEQIENEYVKLWIDDGVMYGEYKSDVVIDLHAAKKVAEDRMKLANGVSAPFLGYLDGMSSVTKEARDYFSKNEGVKYMKKLALITTSPISRILGNFWLQISRPTVPTKLFATKEDALKWLKEV
jgi:hypothetical protein